MSGPPPAPESGDRREGPADWLWARWRLLLVVIVIAFALNSLAGLLLGAFGFVAVAHRLTGRLLKARRVLQQVRDAVGEEPPPS